MLKLNLSRQQSPSRRLGLAPLAFLACSIVSLPTWAQAPFSPPPSQSAPPAVRGIATPGSPAVSPSASYRQYSGDPVTSNIGTGNGATANSSATESPVTSSGAQPLEGGEIVARVDGQIVLASDVLWQVDQLIAANRDRIPPGKVEEARRALMRQQVMGTLDTKMIYANFRRQVPAENIPQIAENLNKPFEEQEVPRLIAMLKLNNRNELDELLSKSGTSIADVKRQFIERTIAGEWLRQMVPKPKEVTHEEMLAYYSEHKKEYEYPAKAKWEEVMIRFDRVDGDRTAAWKAITGIGNEVWQQVAKNPGLRGPVFPEIAKKKSHGFTANEGGGHDWTTKGALRSEEINKALFVLKIGQLSNVIESERGFHIVRVLDRKEAGCTPFTEAQSEIRRVLGQGQKKGLAEEQVAKLRKKSRIWTVFDGELSGPELSRSRNSTQQR